MRVRPPSEQGQRNQNRLLQLILKMNRRRGTSLRANSWCMECRGTSMHLSLDVNHKSPSARPSLTMTECISEYRVLVCIKNRAGLPDSGLQACSSCSRLCMKKHQPVTIVTNVRPRGPVHVHQLAAAHPSKSQGTYAVVLRVN